MSKNEKETDKKNLFLNAVILDGRYYQVSDFPREKAILYGESALRKGMAYRIQTDMTSGLFPYRKELEPKEKWSPYTTPVGIYLRKRKDESYQILISYPHNKKEQEEYHCGKEKSIAVAFFDHDFVPDQFLDLKIKATKGDAFMPPITVDDDFLNTLMKLGIRLKEVPFEPYGKRLEASAVDPRKGIEGINTRNNAKRALLNNTTMSPNKFSFYGNTWELESAVILRDTPGSTNPMFTDGEMLIIYPNGVPFDIDTAKLINANDMIMEAINDGSDSTTDEGEETDDDE